MIDVSHKLLALNIFVGFLNIPFGWYRHNTKKFSLKWMLSLHAPIPLVFILRRALGLGVWAIPFLVISDILGQIWGSKLHARFSKTISTQEKLNNYLCIFPPMEQFIKLLLITTIIIAIVPQSAYAYSQFEGSTSGIVMENHLIEMGYDTSGDTTSSVSRETLVFRSYGDDYSGSLKTWVPDGSTNIFVFKSSHQAEGRELLKHAQNENIITWEADLMQNIPSMYSVEYTTDLESEFRGSMKLTRMISHNALPYPTRIFKLAVSGDDEVVFEDINGKAIIPDETSALGDYRVFSWGSEEKMLELNEISIVRKESGSVDRTEKYMFAILGIIAIIAILYPIISGKLKDNEK